MHTCLFAEHTEQTLVAELRGAGFGPKTGDIGLRLNFHDDQWRQREFKVGGTSLVSRLSAFLTEANWWRLIAE